MAKYYGVTRNEEYLAHYGIRGMKWGVRKAIKKGNEKKLSKLYRKSQKKLQKLNLKADVDVQREYAKRHTRRAIAAAGVGALGLAAYGGISSSARKVLSEANTGLDNIRKRKKTVVGSGKGVHKVGEGLNSTQNNGFVYPEGHWIDINGQTHYGAPKKVPVGSHAVEYTGPNLNQHPALQSNDSINQMNNVSSWEAYQKSRSKKIYRNVALGIGVAGLGTSAYQVSRAIASKYRTTKRGHAKAVAKRDEFKREMNNAFKGTRFDNSRHKRKRG